MNKLKQTIKNTIPYDTAAKTILVICFCVTIFHILILLKIIPYNIVRGGRLTNDAEMYRFESISLAINIFIIFLVAMKGGFIKYIIPVKIVTLLLRGLFFLLIGNTIANVFSESLFEAVFFTILTGALALLIYRLLIEE